jgi:hypothetical protein
MAVDGGRLDGLAKPNGGAPFGPAQKWCAARRISLLSHANALFE